jgi:hypothetical protein
MNRSYVIRRLTPSPVPENHQPPLVGAWVLRGAEILRLLQRRLPSYVRAPLRRFDVTKNEAVQTRNQRSVPYRECCVGRPRSEIENL